jgi:hypothetical protein
VSSFSSLNREDIRWSCIISLYTCGVLAVGSVLKKPVTLAGSTSQLPTALHLSSPATFLECDKHQYTTLSKRHHIPLPHPLHLQPQPPSSYTPSLPLSNSGSPAPPSASPRRHDIYTLRPESPLSVRRQPLIPACTWPANPLSAARNAVH